MLSNKVIIVTGAARGIGRAISIECAKLHSDLVLVDIASNLAEVPYELGNISQLQSTAEECAEYGSMVEVIPANICLQSDISNVVDKTMKRFGRIDVLVNTAGIAAPSGKPIHEMEETEWQILLDVNLSGAWRFIKAVAPIMIKQRSGCIINISSTAGVVGYRNFSGYVASKHGLVGLTKAAALDYASYQIRVNAICPGSVKDEQRFDGKMLSEIAKALEMDLAEYEEIFLQSQPNNELMSPIDIASAVTWLASDAAKRVTGSVLVLDGGFSIK